MEKFVPHNYSKAVHFQLLDLANIHIYTAQCLLTQNVFIEKAYAIAYIWFYGVLVLSIISLIYTIITQVVPSCQKHYVTR